MKKIEIENLVQKLNSSNEEEQLFAIDDLGNSMDDEIYAILIDCMKKETSQIVKDSILFALKRKLSERSFPEIFKLFYSEDAYLRNAGVSIFSSGDKAAIEFLGSRVKESDKEVKKLILDALFEIGTPETEEVISQAIWDEAPNVKITAIEYVGRLGLENSQEDLVAIFESDDEPMIILSILMSLQLFQKFKCLDRITKRLCPTGNMKNLNRMYVGELLKLIAKFGGKKEILEVITTLHENIIDSHEVIEFLIMATNSFRELTDEQAVKDLIITYLQNPVREEKIIFNLFHILNKSNDPKIMKITEDFMNESKSGIDEFCTGLVQTLKLKRE